MVKYEVTVYNEEQDVIARYRGVRLSGAADRFLESIAAGRAASCTLVYDEPATGTHIEGVFEQALFSA